MEKANLKQTLPNSIKEVQAEKFEKKDIFTSAGDLSGKNQFLFFIKPEITLASDNIDFKSILDMMFLKMDEFGLKIQNCKILSAKYLDKYDIIAQHYGVINKISKDAKNNISDTAKERFSKLFGKSTDDARILGSLEFIEKYPEFTPTALDHLWQNAGFEKLAGGTYCQQLKLDGIETYLINGFHPRQLAHFTDKSRSIITFTLVGNTHWDKARTIFIGATNPAKAEKGSIRNDLFENMDKYGLQTVSASWNGAHLSAGPVEGLIELIRYNTDFSSDEDIRLDQYKFGRQLEENFDEKQVQKIFDNVDVKFDGKNISVFDLTEEKNSTEAIEVLKKVIK